MGWDESYPCLTYWWLSLELNCRTSQNIFLCMAYGGMRPRYVEFCKRGCSGLVADDIRSRHFWLDASFLPPSMSISGNNVVHIPLVTEAMFLGRDLR